MTAIVGRPAGKIALCQVQECLPKCSQVPLAALQRAAGILSHFCNLHDCVGLPGCSGLHTIEVSAPKLAEVNVSTCNALRTLALSAPALRILTAASVWHSN